MTPAEPTLFDRLPARLNDPPTSKQQPVRKALRSQSGCLSAFRRYGAMCDRELVTRVQAATLAGEKPWSPSRIRSARSELVAMGKVQDSGQRATVDGSKHIIWRLT